MDISFLKLCKEIKFVPNNIWKFTTLVNTKLENKTFSLFIEFNELIPLNEMKNFIFTLNKNFRYYSKPYFKIINKSFNKNEIFNYIFWILSDIMQENIFAKSLSNYNYEINSNGNMGFYNLNELNFSKYKEIKYKLSAILSKFGFKKDLIIIKNEIKNKIHTIEELKIINFLKDKTLNISETNNNRWIEKAKSKYNYYKEIEIDQLRTTSNTNIQTEGKIFNIERFLTKTNKNIFNIEITNFKEAINLKKFCDEEESVFFKSLMIGDYIKIKGVITNNKYQKDIFINIHQAKKINKIKNIKDDLTEHRIELSCRSKMSVMDGITKPSKLYEAAKKMGQKGLAITDVDNVQGFPEFFNSTKNDNNFKSIYGTTVRIIEEDIKIKIISKNINFNLKNQEYVVFDLETTGLMAKYNGIIEFGACRILNGVIIERMNFYLNPNQNINSTIQELTNISNDDIKDAISEKEGLKKIIKFFNNSVLIAHNARFDMAFIYNKIEKYNIEKIDNIVIDTLFLSRTILPKSKRHSLQYLSARYNVEYRKDVAHRADYDAEVLAKTWLRMVDKLSNDNINNSSDLWKMNSSNEFYDRNNYLITLLAQNNKGLKNIFKLCSISHTTNFKFIPVLYKSDIKKYRDNILVGSGGVEGLIWKKELNNTQKELEEEIEFYDYIEVNPPSNLIHKIYRKEISMPDTENAINNIIKTSKKLNKIVVATSEPRYIYKDDIFIHKIYIESKGLGGSSHRLFKYNEINPKYPILNYMSTKEMFDAFSFIDDKNLIKEIVVTNTNKIADFISKIQVIKEKLYTPKINESSKLLKDLVFKNAKSIYGMDIPSIVKKRMEKELTVIINNKYDVIYWIAHLLVNKSLRSGYIVGSRGSVGSSLIATLSGITDVNPLGPHYYCSKCKYTEFPTNPKSKSGYDLIDKVCSKCNIKLKKDGHTIPFETFLGFKGEKIPDIDLNFSGEFQKNIHDEVKKIFGEKYCFRAGTISTIAERTAFGYIKSWTEKNNIDFSKSYMNYLTKRLSGTKRTTGQHPGGIIIIPEEFDVEDFTPINYPANDITSPWKTTHFDFGAIHNNLLKLDLLGHDDPTIIRMLQDITQVIPNEIPNSDPLVLSLFSSTKALKIKPIDISNETTGVLGIPEFGTPFVRSILKSVKASSFSDLISVSGLSHGTSVWINNAQEDVKNYNLNIDEIISCRDDILNDLIWYGMHPDKAFVIMEQVRRGKSITMIQEKDMINLKVPKWYIESCKKIKYMFPKAHATAYVKVAWKIAWFKIYYPLAYYASYFTIRSDVFDIKSVIINKSVIHNRLDFLKKKLKSKKNIEKITTKEKDLIPIYEICEELYARGFKISTIDIIKSDSVKWNINYDKKILIPPFNVVDGLGDVVAKSIINERSKKEFISIEDFKARTKINKNSLQELIDIKALDGLPSRNQMSLFD